MVGLLALAIGGPIEMIKARTADDSGTASAYGAARVTMAGIRFRPATLEVRRGTEVVFENDDLAPHTVTDEAGGPVDSGILQPGRGVFRLVINEALSYVCQVHPNMRAKIILSG